jgi:hypothetical protein
MRLFRSFILAIACLALLAGPILAQTPVAGAVRYYAPGTQLSYRFGSTTPAWAQNVVWSAASDFSAPGWNNSRTPSFSYSAYGAGAITYTSSPVSPCGTGNYTWIQCSANWGTTGFKIFIRNLLAAPYSNWNWCDVTYAGTCFDAERAMLHEMEHVVLGVGYHDPQGPANTIMNTGSPAYAQYGWNTHHIQRCDEAAAQLSYGVGSPYGQFADCFASIPSAGYSGLVPGWSVSTTTISVCLFQQAVLGGRVAIANIPYSYQSLADSPLAGRTVWFDRKPRTSSYWTLNVTSTTATAASGANWTRAFSTSASTTITYDFRPHTYGETGVDASSGPTIGVTWRVC